jgi:hypothetical protein
LAPCIEAELACAAAALTFRFPRFIRFPEYPVFSLRGLLGHALIAMFHPGLDPAREDPPPDSPYWPLFKPVEGRHSFLFDCAAGNGGGTVLRAVLRVFGETASHLALFEHALHQFQHVGFGGPHERTPYELEIVPLASPSTPWSPDWRPRFEGAFALELLTPAQLAIKVDTLSRQKVRMPMEQVLVSPQPLFFLGNPADPAQLLLHSVVQAAVRHTRELAETYGHGFAQDNERIRRAIWEQTRITRVALRHHEDTSIGERRNVSLGGISGRLELEGPPDLERLLAAGELVGVGSRTAYGCGRLRIGPADARARQPAEMRSQQ